MNPRTDKVERERDTIRLNNNRYHCQGERLYSHNGLSVALNAAGNNDWYTTSDEDEQRIKERWSEDSKGS